MQKNNVHIQHGLIAGLVTVILAALFQVMDVDPQSPVQYVVYLPFATGVILACINFAKSKDYYVTFGNVFSTGFKTAALVTLIALCWMVISFVIFPENKDIALAATEKAMVEQGATETMINDTLSTYESYYHVFMIGATIFGNMFPGLIFALIGAGVAKKKGKLPPHMQPS